MRSAVAIQLSPARIGSRSARVAAPTTSTEWLPTWLWNHTLSMLAVSVSALLVASVWTPTLSVQIWAATFLVAVLGLPHGAVDHWVGRRLLVPRFGRAWLPLFALGYLGAIGLVLAAWAFAPTLALLGFLAVSAFHFGSDPTVPARLGGIWRHAEHALRGSIPIVLVWWFNQSEVNGIFATLLRADSAYVESLVRVDLLAFSVAALGVGVIPRRIALAQRDWRHLVAVAEIVVVASLCALPPLLAFTLYFCGWHSPRHTFVRAARMRPRDAGLALRSLARRAWAPTLAACAMATAGVVIVVGRPDSASVLVSVLFIALSAVTLPHLLVDFIPRARLRR